MINLFLKNKWRIICFLVLGFGFSPIYAQRYSGPPSYQDDLYLGMVGITNFGSGTGVTTLNHNRYWGRAYGTPDYFTPSNFVAFSTNIPSYPNNNEGIFALYKFFPNIKFRLALGISDFYAVNASTQTNTNGSFEIRLVKSATDPLITADPSPNVIPAFPVDSRLIYSFTGTGAALSGSEIIVEFETGALESYDYIVFYPKAGTSNSIVRVHLDCLKIWCCPKADVNCCFGLLDDNVQFCTATIPHGLNYHGSINIGSGSCGSLSSSATGQNTLMRGDNFIDVTSNTNLSVTGDKSVILEIRDCDIRDGEVRSWIEKGPDYCKMYDRNLLNKDIYCRESNQVNANFMSDNLEVAGNTRLQVFPNPASSQVNFTFNFADAAMAIVRIYDITGRLLVYRDFGKQAAGDQRFTLDVSALVNGNYTLELATDNNKSVSKFVIAK